MLQTKIICSPRFPLCCLFISSRLKSKSTYYIITYYMYISTYHIYIFRMYYSFLTKNDILVSVIHSNVLNIPSFFLIGNRSACILASIGYYPRSASKHHNFSLPFQSTHPFQWPKKGCWFPGSLSVSFSWVFWGLLKLPYTG